MNKQKPQFGSLPNLGSPSRKGLVLDLPMLGSGDLNDYSLNGNNGTNNGATWVDGENGPVLSFDGIDDIVTGPYSKPDSAPCTIITRFKTGASGTARPLNVGDVSQNDVYIAVDANIGNDFSFWIRNGVADGTRLYTAVTPTANTWYTMAFTSTGQSHIGYLNGQQVTSDPTAVSLAGWDGYGVGVLRRASTVFSDCEVSYVFAYNRALSAQEIKALYDNPWQAWEKDNIALWAASQAVAGSVNLLDGLFERKRLVG